MLHARTCPSRGLFRRSAVWWRIAPLRRLLAVPVVRAPFPQRHQSRFPSRLHTSSSSSSSSSTSSSSSSSSSNRWHAGLDPWDLDHGVMPPYFAFDDGPDSHPHVVRQDVWVRMRDGARLASTVYRPSFGGDVPVPEPLPVVFHRTPYNKEKSARTERCLLPDGTLSEPIDNPHTADRFARRGYVVVMQDCRGRYQSEGRFTKYVNEGDDGEDALEWIVSQPWCNGKVGTFGLSYCAHVQLAMACRNPPGLAAMFLESGGFWDAYQDGVRYGGAFTMKQVTWAFKNAKVSPEVTKSPSVRAAMESIDLASWFRRVHEWFPGHSPLSLAPDYEGYIFHDWAAQYDGDEWRQVGLCAARYLPQMADVPTLIICSWFDPYVGAMTSLFTHLKAAKHSEVRMVLGPWTHGDHAITYAGEVDFGPQCTFDRNVAPTFQAARAAWFDEALHGRPPGGSPTPGGTPIPGGSPLLGTSPKHAGPDSPASNGSLSPTFLSGTHAALGGAGAGAGAPLSPTQLAMSLNHHLSSSSTTAGGAAGAAPPPATPPALGGGADGAGARRPAAKAAAAAAAAEHAAQALAFFRPSVTSLSGPSAASVYAAAAAAVAGASFSSSVSALHEGLGALALGTRSGGNSRRPSYTSGQAGGRGAAATHGTLSSGATPTAAAVGAASSQLLLGSSPPSPSAVLLGTSPVSKLDCIMAARPPSSSQALGEGLGAGALSAALVNGLLGDRVMAGPAKAPPGTKGREGAAGGGGGGGLERASAGQGLVVRPPVQYAPSISSSAPWHRPMPPVKYFRMGGGSGGRTEAGRLDHGGQWLSCGEWPPAWAQQPMVFALMPGGLLKEQPRSAARAGVEDDGRIAEEGEGTDAEGGAATATRDGRASPATSREGSPDSPSSSAASHLASPVTTHRSTATHASHAGQADAPPRQHAHPQPPEPPHHQHTRSDGPDCVRAGARLPGAGAGTTGSSRLAHVGGVAGGDTCAAQQAEEEQADEEGDEEEKEAERRGWVVRLPHDPMAPVPTIGGNITSGEPIMSGGSFDQVERPQFFGCAPEHTGRRLCDHPGVVAWRTPALERDLEVTGAVRCVLALSSDAPDADLHVTLVDEYPPSSAWPQGFALNVASGIARARIRHGCLPQEVTWLEAGEVATVTVELNVASNLFRKGHCLRLDVSASSFPRYDINYGVTDEEYLDWQRAHGLHAVKARRANDPPTPSPRTQPSAQPLPPSPPPESDTANDEDSPAPSSHLRRVRAGGGSEAGSLPRCAASAPNLARVASERRQRRQRERLPRSGSTASRAGAAARRGEPTDTEEDACGDDDDGDGGMQEGGWRYAPLRHAPLSASAREALLGRMVAAGLLDPGQVASAGALHDEGLARGRPYRVSTHRLHLGSGLGEVQEGGEERARSVEWVVTSYVEVPGRVVLEGEEAGGGSRAATIPFSPLWLQRRPTWSR